VQLLELLQHPHLLQHPPAPYKVVVQQGWQPDLQHLAAPEVQQCSTFENRIGIGIEIWRRYLMPVLKNQRQERFCQALAAGKSASLAYEEAGYVPNRGNASILKANQNIADRVLELQRQQQERLVLSRQSVVDALLENADKALGRKPVKVGPDGVEVYVYRGDVANRALQMLGFELGLFKDKSEHNVNITQRFEKYSDAQIIEMLVEEGKLLLEARGELKHDDGDAG
jgi:phage terminase small subunit